jgi:hypothetical protein
MNDVNYELWSELSLRATSGGRGNLGVSGDCFGLPARNASHSDAGGPRDDISLSPRTPMRGPVDSVSLYGMTQKAELSG